MLWPLSCHPFFNSLLGGFLLALFVQEDEDVLNADGKAPSTLCDQQDSVLEAGTLAIWIIEVLWVIDDGDDFVDAHARQHKEGAYKKKHSARGL